ncbi:hypothetical protein [Mycolicibacterium helvum]|uniref:hypothetical protein n=1 Tax=Mycolicibacterium helvum TaxID=1534349 RepID=UPI0013D5131A|nr:hypothetical protein [Mycolicibacterium helvum]
MARRATTADCTPEFVVAFCAIADGVVAELLSSLWLAEAALEAVRVSDESVLPGRVGFVAALLGDIRLVEPVDEVTRPRGPVGLVGDPLPTVEVDGRELTAAELLVEDEPSLPAVSAAATAAPPIIAAPMPRVIAPALSQSRGLGARRLAAPSHRSNSSR